MTEQMHEPWAVYGVDLSYYTGKVEAILRAKGVQYERHNHTIAERRRTVSAVRIAHMPIIERADGSFMSDSTLIHRWLEAHHPGPALSPVDPAARFAARLIEDWGDEHWWRPAMAWRWLYSESRTVASGRIVDQAMADMRLPRFIKKLIIRARQYINYVYLDGVRTKAHRKAVEDHYLELLDVLEPILKSHPFIMGDRPTEADFGMFAPLFRHFFGDVKTGPIMQDRAPNVMLWCARLWAITPEQIEQAAPVTAIPGDLGPVFDMITRDYLPYLTANAKAVAAGDKDTVHKMQGLEWREPTKPFRLWCLSELHKEYDALSSSGRHKMEEVLGKDAITHLTTPLPAEPIAPPALPIYPITDPAQKRAKVVDSWMR